jgi:DNA replication protein DnaC
MNAKSDRLVEASVDVPASELLSAYAALLGGVVPDHQIKNRPDGPYLVIEFASPTERHFDLLERALTQLEADHPFKERTAIRKRKVAPKNRLLLAETQLLKNEIAESLTIDKNSFGADFFKRYTSSVTGFENQIVANANYAVYGRRGAGKSSLLAYAMHKAKKIGAPFCWIAMQTYAGRADTTVLPAIIADILRELRLFHEKGGELEKLISELDVLSSSNEDDLVLLECDKLAPRLRRLVGGMASHDKPLTIFLDDAHVLATSIQPVVFGYIYKFTRGNNTFIKLSGIAQLTRLWDSTGRTGLNAPNDAQLLQLDRNLTMPDKSKSHIVGILDSHAKYCGLPGIGYLADDDVVSRLVLVAAGVPRDSLNLLSTAISKAAAKNQKMVSITSINEAASEMAEEKLKDIQQDNAAESEELKAMLERVREFCVKDKRINSFLVEIKHSSQDYQTIQKLAALRLVHLLHEGITPNQASKRYIAFMLDYGFYVGIRAARSVQLMPDAPKALSAKDLRSLPKFQV